MKVVAVAVALCVGVGAVRAQCADGRQGTTCEPAPRRSVAVLPFKNLGGDPAQQYFADGIADAITDALAQLPGVKVASRSSAFAFRNSEIGARRIADSLRVATIVEGSFSKSGNRVRVSARLIEANTGYTMWSEQVTTAETDLFELQDTVSRAIASRLGDASGKRLVKRTTISAEAQDRYLRGKELLYRRDPPSLIAAMEEFRLAIRADDRHAQAWAGLSQSIALYVVIQVWPSANKAASGDSAYRLLGRSLAAANKAIAIDSMLPEGWGVRGYVQLYTASPETEQDLRRALRLRPSYAEAHGWLGQFVAFNGGSLVEARDEMAKSVDLDPASIGMRLGNTGTAWWMRDHQRALETAQAVRVLRPEFAAITALYEGPALIALGRPQECLSVTASRPTLNAMCLFALGRRQEAEARIDSLVRQWDGGSSVPYEMLNFASYYGMTGQVDEFIEWLTRSYERVPVYMNVENGGLSDPALRAQGGRARNAWMSLRRAAWDRIVRESRSARLP